MTTSYERTLLAQFDRVSLENAALRYALQHITVFPHPTQAATGDAMKGYLEALNDVGAVAEQALRGEWPLPEKNSAE